MRLRTRWVVALVALVALALTPVLSAADWLVLEDGSRVETSEDGWEVKGKLLVFEMADGTRASLRLSDVDLEASRRATAEAEAAAKAPAKPAAEEEPRPRRANRKITNADIPSGRSRPAQPPAAAGEATDGNDSEVAPEAEGEAEDRLQVTTWESVEDPIDGHLRLRGRVVNPTSSTATGARVVARIYGYGGDLLGTRRTQEAVTVPAEGAASFELDLVDVYEFLAIEFEVEARMLATAPDGFGDGESEPVEPEPDEPYDDSRPER